MKRTGGSLLAGFALLVSCLAVVGAATAVPASAAYFPGSGAWAANGPGLIMGLSDGSESAPGFQYSMNPIGGERSWTFSTVATTAGEVTVPYTYDGLHAYFEVTVFLRAYVVHNERTTTTTLISDGPTSCCTAPSNGFHYTGQYTFAVQAGDEFGFVVGGNNYDENNFLNGSLTLSGETAVASTVTYEGETKVTIGEHLDLAASVSPAECPQDGFSYLLEVSPIDEEDSDLFPLGNGPSVDTTGWIPGTYDLVADYAGNVDCLPSDVSVSITVEAAPFNDPDAVADNTSWPNATLIDTVNPAFSPMTVANVFGTIAAEGEARWFKFPVTPDSEVQVDLTQLAQNYDLALYRDIDQAFATLTSKKDLLNLSAQFAADAYSPSIYSPSIYSPSIYSPSIYSPSIYSPSIYSPSIYSPSIYSPSIYSPSIYSPSIYSPSIYSPSIYSPSIYSPSPAFVEAFSSAQTRSLIAVSARDGLADESIRSATWNNTGYFYVRVQGRNGAWSPTPFSLSVTTTGGECSGTALDPMTSTSSLTGTPGSATTVILTDSSRMGLGGQVAVDFAAKLQQLASATDGVVVDVAASDRVADLNTQADEVTSCPYAKNLVGEAIRDIVNSYRDDRGTLKYVVIAGGDSVIPFFRYPDAAGIGPESDYVPPVAASSASEASLRRNTVLGQDAYGSELDVPVKAGVLPLPDLAVGRLVEFADEITGMIDSYLGLDGGTLPEPTSSLVTGYDFLTSAADAVESEFTAGLAGGSRFDTLITDQGVPTSTTTVGGVPSRSTSWTAADLSNALFGSRHDLVFLAGHFSANSTLAADYKTSTITTELDAHPGLLTNSLVFSAGCHSGYNLVDGDGIPGLTLGLDWAQAMARQKAVFVGGTGYQYADTDFLAYSARLYTQFAAALRTGTAGTPVAVGQALVQAKQDYLAERGSLNGIDLKSLIESTLFGLPMTGMDLPGRVPNPPLPVNTPTNPVLAGPGSVLGLETATKAVTTSNTPQTKPVLDLDGQPTGAEFRWLEGPDGVQTGPGLPALPQQIVDVTSDNGDVLRGVGLRSATYTDLAGVTPLTGAPTTEQNGVHTSFDSPVFFPQKLWTVSYFDALTDGEAGRTQLVLTPAQYRAEPGTDPLTNTERSYSSVDLDLFYSSNITTYGDNTPALAAPPSITAVDGTVDTSGVPTLVDVSAHVTGDPSAGIQQVWVTFTGEAGPFHGSWQSVDLTQDANDSTLWAGSFELPDGQDPADVRFIVQAANGVGLVSLDNNQGDGYTPGVPVGNIVAGASATTLALDLAATTAPHGSTVTVAAVLSGAPAGATVEFALGSTAAAAVTNGSGRATVSLSLQNAVGDYTLVASYAGDVDHAPAADSSPFTITKEPTTITLSMGATSGTPAAFSSGVSAALTRSGSGAPLPQRTVYFVLQPTVGDPVVAARTTDPSGRADLGTLPMSVGTWTVTATFLGDVPLPTGTVTLSDATFLATSDGPEPLVVGKWTTSLTYTGAASVVAGAPLALAAVLTKPDECPALPISYELNRNPYTGEPGTYVLGGESSVPTSGWFESTYVLTARYAGDGGCAASSSSRWVVVRAEGSVAGSGSYRVGGQTVKFTLRAGRPPVGRANMLTIEQAKRYRFTATTLSLAITGPGAGSVRGVGVLEWWNPRGSRRGSWQVVGTSVAYTASFAVSSARRPVRTFGITLDHDPGPTQPAVPNSAPQVLRTGSLRVV